MDRLNGEETSPWIWRAALFWVAALQITGWGLSGLGMLHTTAYAVVIPALAGVTWIWHGCQPLAKPRKSWKTRWNIARRRYRRLLPASFLGVAALAVLSGLIYEPNNVDALAYRTPRVLHWLSENRWHWIECPYDRLNTRATGFEWLTAPWLALTRSDRGFFLWNVGAFLLLPGLVFTTLRNLGLGTRIAWTWMWLFPGGYCLALQAGSIGNDLYGTTTSLAALAFALRARRSQQFSDLVWSTLAIALTTGSKLSNLPLLLPWVVALWPSRHLVSGHPIQSAVCLALAACVSILPMSALNQRFAGDWTGASAEYAWTLPPDPISSSIHNTLLMGFQNLMPPILPIAGAWNRRVVDALPEFWKERLDGFAEGERNAYALRELPGEEHAGLGFGITWLLLLQGLAGMREPSSLRTRIRCRLTNSLPFSPAQGTTKSWTHLVDAWWMAAFVIAPIVALAPWFAKSGIQTAARILAPYYPWLMVPLLVAGAGSWILRKRWWRTAVWLHLACLFVVLILLPTRPLWPAQSILGRLTERSTHPSLERARIVYDVYAQRARAFAPILAHLPESVQELGWITGNDAETSLWKPYGQRRVRHLPVKPGWVPDPDRHPEWCLINVIEMERQVGVPFEEWCRTNAVTIRHRQPIRLLASREADEFSLVTFQLNTETH